MLPKRIRMQSAFNTFTSFKERILSGKKEKEKIGTQRNKDKEFKKLQWRK